MRLARGHILLIAGGAIVALSFFAGAYYVFQILQEIQDVNKNTIQPDSSIEFRQNITSGDGAYFVAFPDYIESPTQASVRVDNPSGATVLIREVNIAIFDESFAAETMGNYTLTLTNTSDAPVNASVIFGERQAVNEAIGTPTMVSVTISQLLLWTGIIVLIAGGAILVLDRRKAQKMRQFGDMSDLV